MRELVGVARRARCLSPDSSFMCFKCVFSTPCTECLVCFCVVGEKELYFINDTCARGAQFIVRNGLFIRRLIMSIFWIYPSRSVDLFWLALVNISCAHSRARISQHNLLLRMRSLCNLTRLCIGLNKFGNI